MATTTPSAPSTSAARSLTSATATSPAPPKPWERAASGSVGTQSIAGRTALDSASNQMSASAGMNTTSTLNSAANSALSGYGAGTSGAYGSNYGSAIGSSYGTGIGSGYGTGGLGSAYGGGYGSSLGGMGGYGGYSGGYGGYGSSYGGGGYGGYGSSYGGGYMRGGYGMMGGMNGAMDPNGNMGWLSSFNQMVSSIGQITDMLGMNAEALNFCIGSFVHFVERIGAMFAGIASLVSPKPQFPPGHPRHGEPGLSEEEEKSRQRRVRILQFMLTMVAVTVMYKGARWLASLRRKQPALLTAKPAVPVSSRTVRDLESIFKQTVGQPPVTKPTFGMMK